MQDVLKDIRRIRGELFACEKKLEAMAKELPKDSVEGCRTYKAASDLYSARCATDSAEDMILRITGVRGN